MECFALVFLLRRVLVLAAFASARALRAIWAASSTGHGRTLTVARSAITIPRALRAKPEPGARFGPALPAALRVGRTAVLTNVRPARVARRSGSLACECYVTSHYGGAASRW